MKDNHGAIHKLVWAIKALMQAEELVTSSTAIDHIRNAKNLCWSAGEDLQIDIAKQIKETEALS